MPPTLVKKDQTLTSIDEFPVLNKTGIEFTFKANFYKDCGDDNICTSDLTIQPIALLTNNKYSLGKDTDVQLYVQITNNKEPAYEPCLYIFHSRTLDFVSSKVRQSGAKVNCKFYNSTVVACSLTNPFTSVDEIEIILRFEPSPLINLFNLGQWDFLIFANSTSEEYQKTEPERLIVPIEKQANVGLKGYSNPEQIYFGGEKKGEAAVKYDEEVGSFVEHVYQIYNEGPWISNDITIEIYWPHQLDNNKEKGKWLLYLLEEPILDSEFNYLVCF